MASDRIEIVKELRALEQFCTFKAVRTGEEQERYMLDYLADIQEYPLEAIRKACAEWRKSGVTKFPSSGQLIPMIRKHVTEERAQPVREWRPISDEEYERLSVRDKIRHRLILAKEARVEASAKTHGWDRNILTAPPAYRHWMDVAAGHEREAMRLRQFITQPGALTPQSATR